MYIRENTDGDHISVQSNVKIKTHISNNIVEGPVDKREHRDQL